MSFPHSWTCAKQNENFRVAAKLVQRQKPWIWYVCNAVKSDYCEKCNQDRSGKHVLKKHLGSIHCLLWKQTQDLNISDLFLGEIYIPLDSSTRACAYECWSWSVWRGFSQMVRIVQLGYSGPLYDTRHIIAECKIMEMSAMVESSGT